MKARIASRSLSSLNTHAYLFTYRLLKQEKQVRVNINVIPLNTIGMSSMLAWKTWNLLLSKIVRSAFVSYILSFYIYFRVNY